MVADLVLFGATGYVGGKLLEEALRRYHRVTAVARDAGFLQPNRYLRVVSGSIYDTALVDQLTAGADVLISAVPARPTDDGALRDAVPALAEVARRHRVRLAVVGGAGSLLLGKGGRPVATQLGSAFPSEMLREATAHIEVLAALQETPADVDWFCLSPPVTFGAHAPGERLGRYRLGTDVMLTDEHGNSAISGDDYALAFLDEIERPKHHRQRFTVGY